MSIVHIAFYPSDWLAGTRGLSDAEAGVYINLICRMYEMAGPIERDDNRLARVCGCKSKASFVKSLNYLIAEGKIIQSGQELFNERVQKEIKNTTEKSSKAKSAAQSRWDKKSNKNNDSTDANASSEHMLDECQSEPESEPDNKKDTKKVSRFQEFWDAFSDKRGRDGAERVWNRKHLDNVADEVIAGAKAYVKSRGDDRKYWKQAQGWLNDGRWKDSSEATPNKGKGTFYPGVGYLECVN